MAHPAPAQSGPASVRTFRAKSMQAALDLVQQELGPEAVILQTREIAQPRFMRWLRTDDKVEITATTSINIPTPKGMLKNQELAAKLAASANFSQTPASRTPLAPANNSTTTTRPSPFQGRPITDAGLSLDTATSYSRTPGTNNSTAHADNYRPAPTTSTISQQHPQHAYQPVASRTEQSRQIPPINLATSQLGSMLQQTGDPQHITRQLNSIQQMVERLSRNGSGRGEEIQSELFHLYTALIDAEVDEDLSRELICRLKENITPHELAQPLLAKQRLCELVEAEIRCSAPITTTPGRRKVVALVGPTGVGKTTTIAKLAANFRLRNGIRMGLVTVDTYRIAAVEQLRTYAEIIDLPMKVVTSPRDMRRALDELSGLDLVLIDTAGRSPHDELKIQKQSLLQEAQVDEVHLVLSLVSSPRSQQAIAEKFAPAGTTAMILTKLDEAVGMGTLLSVSRKVPLPVSYLTTGQDVPDDIEIANTRRISRLILGEEKLFARRRHES